VPEIPEYRGWKKHFALVDTAFGEKTALSDKRTGLEWLHVNLTASYGESRLSVRMRPGGDLDGWRFATEEEVLRFFVDFTGTRDGQSKDAGLERTLQRLLGGPTNPARNELTGWSRRATSVRIAGLTPATHDETPMNPAMSAGAPPPCSQCGVGYIYHSAYIAEDTQNGGINASVVPDGRGWMSADGGGTGDTFFVVRRKR
jgi:hypothetical protein